MAIVKPSAGSLAAFRVLATEYDLAAFLSVSWPALRFHLYGSGRPSYRHFLLRKAAGGTRQIAAPPERILAFQRRILQCLTVIAPAKRCVHGFSIGRSVKTNAHEHVAQTLVLNIDLEDFFPSIHFGRVRGMFNKRPFNFPHTIAALLAHICCYDGRLPQGAPTSPIISTLICRGLDRDLERFAKRHGCRYTRYADDITFSSDKKKFSSEVIEPTGAATGRPVLAAELKHLINKHDFRVNDAKTRLRNKNERLEVTGLVVNKKVNVPRRFVRNIRSILHSIERHGLATAQAKFVAGDRKQRTGPTPDLRNHLKGKLAFLQMVRGSDDPLFVKLALRSHAITPVTPFGVPISGNSGQEFFWNKCLWIVIATDHAGTEHTATAFTLGGTGIVSASHTFDTPGIASWEIVPADDPFLRHPITSVRRDPRVDLAVLHTPASPQGALVRSEQTIGMGEHATVLGFPAWFGPADRLAAAACRVNQVRRISLVDYVLLSTAIRQGNSGGPILNRLNEVVGVALWDHAGAAAPNGGVCVHHVADASRAVEQLL